MLSRLLINYKTKIRKLKAMNIMNEETYERTSQQKIGLAQNNNPEGGKKLGSSTVYKNVQVNKLNNSSYNLLQVAFDTHCGIG